MASASGEFFQRFMEISLPHNSFHALSTSDSSTLLLLHRYVREFDFLSVTVQILL